MNATMEFLWSLAQPAFDSWNDTYRIDQFSENVPGFDYLSSDQQETLVNNLNSQDIQDLKDLWDNRASMLSQPMNFTTFLNAFIFDPLFKATTTPAMTSAEFCATYKDYLVFIHSLYFLIPSVICLCFLTCVKRRHQMALDCCWGRPSFVVPLNFIDEHGRRWAFCGAFAMMTSFLLDFFDGSFFWYPGKWEDPTWTLTFSWLKPFILLGNVIHLGFLFYPLFACLTMRRHIPANILGLISVGLWIYFHVSELLECPLVPDKSNNQLSADSITRLVTTAIVFIGELAVLFAFIMDLLINCYKLYQEKSNISSKYLRKSKREGKERLPLQYIEYLMTAKKEPPTTFLGKIKNFFWYKSVSGFRYPPRVISTMVVAFILLLSLAIYMGTTFNRILVPIQEGNVVENIFEFLLAESEANSSDAKELVRIVRQAPRYVAGVRACFIFSNVVSAVIHFGSMIHMAITYRNHVRLVMKGDHSWHHTYTSKPPNVLVAGLRYSGYQIAYILWGYIIMFILLLIVSNAFTIIFTIPLTFGERPWLLDSIIVAVTTAVATLLINYSQLFICKFLFLQENGKYLALNNRRVYHGLSYFIFFFNIVVGAFSILRRSLLSMIFGTLLLCRLDRCLLMRGFEVFDSGFSAYMGMLQVDATHNHPVMKGFIYILKSEVKDSQERRKVQNGDIEEGLDIGKKGTRRIDKRIRNKWWKLITLVNNPELVLERIKHSVTEEKNKKMGSRDEIIDRMADVGAVFAGTGVLAMGSATNSILESTPL